jgi:endonuclease/exonuclease/phosphatase family metal-dependent hydrolase
MMPSQLQPSPHQLCLYQLNCNTSNDAQLIILNSLNPNNWDIIALQELYIDFNGVTQATHPWRVVYPLQHYQFPKETQSAMLINKHLATNCWESLLLDSSDITAICLLCNFSKLHIFNIYNDCTHSCTLTCLEQFLLASAAAPTTPHEWISDIWLGDFNRHNPLWECLDNSQLFSTANLDAAEILIDLSADFGMNIILNPGVPTLKHMVTKNLHWVRNPRVQ